jgi:hypothetical protein
MEEEAEVMEEDNEARLEGDKMTGEDDNETGEGNGMKRGPRDIDDIPWVVGKFFFSVFISCFY